MCRHTHTCKRSPPVVMLARPRPTTIGRGPSACAAVGGTCIYVYISYICTHISTKKGHTGDTNFCREDGWVHFRCDKLLVDVYVH